MPAPAKSTGCSPKPSARVAARGERGSVINYLGFPFWDLLTFPVMTWREVGEFNELLVDRISVHDARALKTIECAQKLKGIFFEHTAAFLSRAYRENDYLLGRLTRSTGSSTSSAIRQAGTC